MHEGFNLNTLLSFAEVPAPAPAASLDDPLDRFRASLAIRGWTSPIALIKDISGHDPSADKEPSRLLSALAPDVETLADTRPGQWYLDAAARRSVLARFSRAALELVCAPVNADDEADPLRRAYEMWIKDAVPPIEKLDSSVLKALDLVRGWVGDGWTAAVGQQEIKSELATRALHADLDRLTKYPLVGKSRQVARESLIEFARAPRTELLKALYIYGGGGGGKTTLLAFVQKALFEDKPPVASVRIDFDDAAIIPSRMATLNLALYEQLIQSNALQLGHAQYLLTSLREQVALQRTSALNDETGAAARGPAVKHAYIAAESAVSQAASDESSIVYGTLAPNHLTGPLNIVLDTAELVLAKSDRDCAGILNWINFLQLEAGATDIRLVIAGRDPPTAAGLIDGYAQRNLLARLADAGARFSDAIALPDLEPDEAADLLRNCGIKDESVVAAASQAVPGNPLLLRITAEALIGDDGAIVEAVHEAHRQSRVDPGSARAYLMKRIVAHVDDPNARPYVIGAMFLPFVTRPLLEEAIIPAVERNGKMTGQSFPSDCAPTEMADRVFRALECTLWLTRGGVDSKSIAFDRNIRELVLRLVRVAEADSVFERDIRQAATIHHQQNRGPFHRAMALYHLAVLGAKWTKPRDREMIADLLRDVWAELPEGVQTYLRPEDRSADSTGAGGPEIVRTMSDAEWKRYLEGDPGRDGEGMLLVKDDQAQQALDLYFDRPTREEGCPPPFVVRALADLGDWDNESADIGTMVDAEDRRILRLKELSPDDVSQVYWITRLAMLANKANLSDQHVELLEHVCSLARGPGLTLLPALIAVAEAKMGRPIMDNRMRDAALRTGNEPRMMLTGVGSSKRDIEEVASGSLAVVQRDWCRRILAEKGLASVGNSSAVFRSLQRRMDGLAGKPIADVNRTIEKADAPTLIKPEALDWPARVVLLRGRTPEFYRPLREALLSRLDAVSVRISIDATLEQMSIRPAEMVRASFLARLEANPRAWITALIHFADQCRLLPLLLQGLAAEQSPGGRSQVAASFFAWDLALSRGHPYSWPWVGGERP